MKITIDISDDVIARAVAQQIAERHEAVELLTLGQAAERLSVSKDKARSLFKRDWIDLGAQSPRVRLADVRRLIAERSIKL